MTDAVAHTVNEFSFGLFGQDDPADRGASPRLRSRRE